MELTGTVRVHGAVLQPRMRPWGRRFEVQELRCSSQTHVLSEASTSLASPIHKLLGSSVVIAKTRTAVEQVQLARKSSGQAQMYGIATFSCPA